MTLWKFEPVWFIHPGGVWLQTMSSGLSPQTPPLYRWLARFARSLSSTSAPPVYLQGSPKSATFLFLDQLGWFYKYAFSIMSWWHPENLSLIGSSIQEEFDRGRRHLARPPPRLPLYTNGSFASLAFLDVIAIAEEQNGVHAFQQQQRIFNPQPCVALKSQGKRGGTKVFASFPSYNSMYINKWRKLKSTITIKFHTANKSWQSLLANV